MPLNIPHKSLLELRVIKKTTTRKKKAVRERVEIDGKWHTKRGVHLSRNDGWETESEHMGKIRSALRNASRFWKPATKCLEAASRPYQGPDKRKKKEYQCNSCKKWFIRAKVEVNHKEPCGSLRCYADIPAFLVRLFIENVSGYEVLCKGVGSCHQKETNAQRNGE